MIGSIKTYKNYQDIKNKVFANNTEIVFKYEYEDDYINLSLTKNERYDDEADVLDDRTEIFDYRNDELFFDLSFNIENLDKLFGDEGIASENDVIGLGLVFKSRSSLQRDAVAEIAEISKNDDRYFAVNGNAKINYFNGRCILEYNSDKQYPFSLGVGKFNSDLIIQLICYIKDCSKRSEDEKYKFCTVVGQNLGTLWEKQIRLKPNFELFPIKKYNLGENDLLYKVVFDNYNDEDAVENLQFVRCITVYFNEDHPSYCYLDRSSDKFDNRLRIEVLSRCILEIVRIFNENSTSGTNLSECPSGSYGLVMDYFKKQLSLPVLSRINTNKDTKKIFNILKGYFND